MPKTIIQKILFRNTTPKALYDIYINAKKHTAATGAMAKINSKEGSNFTAHGGYISGRNLQIVKNRQLVQSWRAQGWDKEIVDSILLINFEPKGKDTVLHLVHANIPDKHVKGIDHGWHEHYWEPWKKFLAGKPVPKSPVM